MRKYVLVLLSIFFITASFAQSRLREEVYLHLNATFLLTGETLLFSAYVNEAAMHMPSPLSKILYVELVNKEGEPVFQDKIKLKHGRGQGEFFIPSIMATGNYQLLAYTRWMKNFNDYFQLPITIVNPFEAYKLSPMSEKKAVNIEFYPSSGGLIANLKNKIAFRATNKTGEAITFKGKIVNEAGDKVLDFEPSREGIGHFSFTPEDKQIYQAILEDNRGEFHFFSLPEVKSEGAVIAIEEEKDSFMVKVFSSGLEPHSKVIVHNNNTVILSQKAGNNASIVVNKNELEKGLHQVALINGKDDTLSTAFLLPDFSFPAVSEDKKVYGNCDEFKASFNTAPGNYSISVRKAKPGLEGNHSDAISYTLVTSKLDRSTLPVSVFKLAKSNQTLFMDALAFSKIEWDSSSYSEVKLLPEYRGELLTGTLKDAVSRPMGKVPVAISVLGEDQVTVTKTDKEGNFVANIPSLTDDYDGYVQALRIDSNYSVFLDEPFLKDYPPINSEPLYLDSVVIAGIISSSIKNQIENAYFEVKKDSLTAVSTLLDKFNFDFFYVLDDYNRFPKIEESFAEYIPSVTINRKNGLRYFKVRLRTRFSNPDFDEPPLVLIDGVPTNAMEILEFSPYKVKSIGVIDRRVYLGPMVFDGVIAFHTFQGDLHTFSVNKNAAKIQLKGLQPLRQYEFPTYSKQNYSESSLNIQKRIPDLREQLYWDPNVKVEEEEMLAFSFYTSNTDGKFEILVEGFTNTGEAVSIVRYFEVK